MTKRSALGVEASEPIESCSWGAGVGQRGACGERIAPVPPLMFVDFFPPLAREVQNQACPAA